MIVQPGTLIAKQSNHLNDRDCLHGWNPQTINDNVTAVLLQPYEIYTENNVNKDLLEQNSTTNRVKSACQSNNRTVESSQLRKQNLAPNERPYHSIETINEALKPPWALDYEIQQKSATPNIRSNLHEMSTQDEPLRRLKSAPVVHLLPVTPPLIIPQPHFITPVIPVSIVNENLSPTRPQTRPKTRATSAVARLCTTAASNNNHPSNLYQPNIDKKISDEEIKQILKRVYGNRIEHSVTQQKQPIELIYTQGQTPSTSTSPVYMYQKAESWRVEQKPVTPVQKSIEVSAIPLNPHYIHRPGVVSVKNNDKNSIVRERSLNKTPHRHRQYYHHSQGRRSQPLLAHTPISQKSRISLEIDGVRLKYDPKLTLNDKSPNITKYFIDGRLYLIKNQSYNILDNVDPMLLQNYNESLNSSQRPKSHQVSSSTYIHNTVIDPKLISQNLSTTKPYSSNRPKTAPIYG